MRNNYIVTAIVAIIVGVGAFFAGSHFAGSSSSQNSGSQSGARFTTRGGTSTGAARAFNGTAGTIVSVTGNNLTIQMSNGSSEVVFFGSSVPITKTVSGSSSDLTPGTTVLVTGSANSDGSLTAQSIQIRPLGAGGQNPSGASANSGSSAVSSQSTGQ